MPRSVRLMTWSPRLSDTFVEEQHTPTARVAHVERSSWQLRLGGHRASHRKLVHRIVTDNCLKDSPQMGELHMQLDNIAIVST